MNLAVSPTSKSAPHGQLVDVGFLYHAPQAWKHCDTADLEVCATLFHVP
jgi:hypothetical protein